MIRKLEKPRLIAALALAAVFAASVADAIPNRPRGARQFTAEFVKHYTDCLSPNDATLNPFVSRAACAPPVMSEPSCVFDPNGRGKVKIKSDIVAGDLDYKLKMRHLSTGCVGQTLEFIIKYQQTNDDCSAGDCTAENVEQTIGSCVVSASGACTMVGSANAFLGGPLFAPGLETSLTLHGCGVRLAGGEVAFACGLLID